MTCACPDPTWGFPSSRTGRSAAWVGKGIPLHPVRGEWDRPARDTRTPLYLLLVPGAAWSRDCGAEWLLEAGSKQGPQVRAAQPTSLGIKAVSPALPHAHLCFCRPLEAVERQLLWQVPKAVPQPCDPTGRETARDCTSFLLGSQLKTSAQPCAQARHPLLLPWLQGGPEHRSAHLPPWREPSDGSQGLEET